MEGGKEGQEEKLWIIDASNVPVITIVSYLKDSGCLSEEG